MKKTLLLLIAPIAMHSQINFGAKTGVAFIDNLDKNKDEFFDLKDPVFFAGFIEYKSIDIAGEFELMYYNAKSSSGTEVQALVPSLSFKYYADEKFDIKTGIYLNSSSVDFKLDEDTEIENMQLDDMGIMFGMEVLPYKGILIDARMFFDLNKSDDIRTKHLLLGIGYKF